MENASKALIMAASVLLGVMILSIGVYIFFIFAEYSQSTYTKMEETQITQFNSQFLKYYGDTNRSYINESTGKEESVQEPIKCTAHDIISIANLANQNNIENELEELSKYNEAVCYIQIDVYDSGSRPKLSENLEKWTEEKKLEFINLNSNTDYKCSEIIISDITKRVCYMKFQKL